MDGNEFMSRLGEHRRFCYQEDFGICLHPKFLIVYDTLDDDTKENIMALVSVLRTVKNPNGLGYGSSHIRMLDVGSNWRITYSGDRTTRELTFYALSKHGNDNSPLRIPKNGGWERQIRKRLKCMRKLAIIHHCIISMGFLQCHK